MALMRSGFFQPSNSEKLQLVEAKCSFDTPLCLVYEEEIRESKYRDELKDRVVGQMRNDDHLRVWYEGLGENFLS